MSRADGVLPGNFSQALDPATSKDTFGLLACIEPHVNRTEDRTGAAAQLETRDDPRWSQSDNRQSAKQGKSERNRRRLGPNLGGEGRRFHQPPSDQGQIQARITAGTQNTKRP